MRFWEEETVNTDSIEKAKSKDGKGLEGIDLVLRTQIKSFVTCNRSDSRKQGVFVSNVETSLWIKLERLNLLSAIATGYSCCSGVQPAPIVSEDL